MRLTIETDNAAFGDEPGVEVAGILRDVANRAENGQTSGTLLDSNGNTVGSWSL